MATGAGDRLAPVRGAGGGGAFDRAALLRGLFDAAGAVATPRVESALSGLRLSPLPALGAGMAATVATGASGAWG